MRAVAKVAWRTYRLEILVLAVAAVLVFLVEVFLAWRLNLVRPSETCLADFTPDCPRGEFYSLTPLGGQVLVATGVLPLAVGAVLGSQTVAAEIERRTAEFAWALSASRLRWLAERLGIAGAIALLLLVPLAVSSTLLEGALEPLVSPFASLKDLGLRGPSVVTAGLALFGVGLLAGAVLGRVLPAVLLSSFAAVVIFGVLPQAALLMQSDEVIGQMGERAISYSIVRRDAFLAPDGHELPHDQGIPTTGGGSAGPDGVRWVGIGVAGTRYPAVETALVSLQGLVGFGGVLATVVVVRRRRPL